MNRWQPFVLTALTLSACSQSPESSSDFPPEPVGNYDTVDGHWSLTPRFTPQALTPDGVNTLRYERALALSNSWGPVELDRSNGEQAAGDGRPLTLGGVRFPSGYGVHAPSELQYSLAGTDQAQCVRFKARIGIDDEVGSKGSAIFQVWGDEGKLFDSGVMTGTSPTQQISVDVRRQSTLRLVVTDAGNGKSFDHADWIQPTLVCVPNITLSVPSVTGIPQDTHGTVPVEVNNQSRTFRGDLTFQILRDSISTEPYPGFRLDAPTVRLTQPGITRHPLSVYVDPRVTPSYNEPGYQSLSVSYAGEEITRVDLGVHATEQYVSVTPPPQVVELHAGESWTYDAEVRMSPGGAETTDLDMWIQEYIGMQPQWWSVRGGGFVPRTGGTLPITVTATRAPAGDEPTEVEALVYVWDWNFTRLSRSQFIPVTIRFLP